MEVVFTRPESLAGSIAIPFFEGEARAACRHSAGYSESDAARRAVATSRFAGRVGDVVEWLVPRDPDCNRLVFFGLGSRDKFDGRRLEAAIGPLVERLVLSGEDRIDVDLTGLGSLDCSRAGLAARMAAYRFDQYRPGLEAHKKPSVQTFGIVVDDVQAAEAAWQRWGAVAAGVEMARDLVNEPANILTPVNFAHRLERLRDAGIEVECLDEVQIKRLGMNALLGVSQGSVNPPRLVLLQWRGGEAGQAPLLFVGKGLTFDAGGLSLKPLPSMADMKNDMGGAAAIAGLMLALATRRARVNACAVLALVENMPDGAAQRPSDIVTSMSGQTIEVCDTDAEGRLVLADALWFGQQKFTPAAIIDAATLTGNVIATLGYVRAGLMSSDDELARAVEQAGEASGELVWRFPIGAEYDFLIESSVADVKNVGEGPMFASSIAGAKFLQKFVTCAKWCHIDIAGVSICPKEARHSLQPSWATGFGVRLLDELVSSQFETRPASR
jgi:leucyl aminopeptidase